ncbi:MAG: Trk system potassium uptake protein TrkH, partial [Planctomycetota bacterium]
GLTTTGATVLASAKNMAIEQVPPSLLLWRASLQWIGGLGIVLVFAALLPAMGVTSKNLLTSETVGVGTETYQPRVLDKARMILFLYTGMTAACALLLVLVGGFSTFDAICHAFTALATGGYSTRGSLAAFDSLGGEIVLIVFMFLAGASLAVLATHLRTGLRCIPALLRTGEFRIYTVLTLALVAALTFSLVRAGLPFGTALRQAAFNGVSVLTSTGYATADFQAWPTFALVALFCAMFIGGCTGSTAGGIKMVRVLVVLKLFAYTIRHFVRPKSVERIKLDEEALPAAVISSIVAIVLLWLTCIVVGAALIALDERLNFVAAFATSASMMGSCGPALTMVDPASAVAVTVDGGTAVTLAATPNVGPFGGYGELHDATKIVLIAQMVLGRLELLTLLALFTPSFWRR